MKQCGLDVKNFTYKTLFLTTDWLSTCWGFAPIPTSFFSFDEKNKGKRIKSKLTFAFFQCNELARLTEF
jgi:hypothetical protein